MNLEIDFKLSATHNHNQMKQCHIFNNIASPTSNLLTDLMKSQAKAATQVVVRTSARARLRHSWGQLGGGARGRGSDTARAAWGYKEYCIVTSFNHII